MTALDFPMFRNHASCADAINPDMWFPEEKAGYFRWSYTPSAQLARAICRGCEAFDECKEYALRYKNLSGIWADQDRHERRAEQINRGITPIPVYTKLDMSGRNKDE